MAQSEPDSQFRYANDPDHEPPEAIVTRLGLTPPQAGLPFERRGREVLKLAQEVFTKTGNWVVFYRRMLGPEGVVRGLFPDTDELRKFEASREFSELQEMVAALRSQDPSKADAAEPERMITIRLPKSLHDTLKREAESMNLSINKLCISKLLQRVESRYIPIQQGRRRGRKPGPQGPRNKPPQSAAISLRRDVRNH